MSFSRPVALTACRDTSSLCQDRKDNTHTHTKTTSKRERERERERERGSTRMKRIMVDYDTAVTEYSCNETEARG